MYSAQSEEERRQQLLLEAAELLTPEELEALLPEIAAAKAAMWKDGIEPMPFDEFSRAVDGVALLPRQVKVFSEAGIMRASDIMNNQRAVNEMVLMWGKGSGKDWLSARFIAYVAYVVLHLSGNAAEHFGLTAASALHIINVAPTEAQARGIFFQYLLGNIKSPLFKKFITNYREQIGADSIKFPQANLFLLSMHSRSSSLEGYNVLAWIMDEADDFVETEAGSTADTIHRIFRSSAATRMGNRSIGLVISYPRTAEGFMMRLKATIESERRTQGDRCGYYFDQACTWDVRPGVNIQTNSIMQSDYRLDPALAAAMYECKPLPIGSGWFEMPEKIDELVDENRFPVASVWESIISCESPVDGRRIDYVGAYAADLNPVPGRTYFLGVDGGEMGDSFCMAVFHIDETSDACTFLCSNCGDADYLRVGARYERVHPRDRQGALDAVAKAAADRKQILCGACGTTPWHFHATFGMLGWWVRQDADLSPLVIGDKVFRIPRIHEDLLVEVRPHRATKPGDVQRTVDFATMQELARTLICGLPVAQARFDPWNTVQMVQTLQIQTGCDVDKISFAHAEQYSRARLVKALTYSNMLTLLPNEKRDREWKRLQRSGTRVDHPKGAGESKDLYDAEAVAIWLAATYKCSAIETAWVDAGGTLPSGSPIALLNAA